MAAADGEQMVGDGELLHQQAAAAPVVEPTGARGSCDENQSEDEESGRASAAPPNASASDGWGMMGASELLHEVLPDAPAADPMGARGSSGEIQSVQEDSSRALAAPPTSVRGHGLQQHAPMRFDVEIGGRGSTTNQRTVTRANNWGTLLCASAHPKCAKWVYTALFLGGMVLAMFSRDVEVSAFSRTERDHGCEHDRYCLGAESALRVSLAFFGFFTIMFCSTVWTKKMQDCRNFWNSNLGVMLLIKVVLVVGCIYVVEMIPSPIIQFYGNVARFGAWLFLAIQLISVTRFIMWLNKWHQSNPERRSACKRWLVKATAIILNFGSFGVIFWLLHEHRSNKVDFRIVIVTLVLILLMIFMYLQSEVTVGWLAHGVMIAYVVFTSWTVLKSEPHTDVTKGKHRKGADWLTITSFIAVFIVTTYSTVSTGEDHEWVQFNEEVPTEDDIPYRYGYFHLVFALGSMYFGMLLVGWNAHQTMQRWTIDFGWWSAVVRAVNGVVAAVFYIWMLRTPIIWNKTKLVLSRPGGSLVPHVSFL